MVLDADTIIDRRRLARRLSFWRAAAILAVVLAVAGTILAVADPRGQHVARLPIAGAIVSNRALIELIDDLKKDDRVAGVLVAIDSPGGTSVGGERLYNALRALDEAKPVVAHINTLGASAAYMAALASDHIVAHRTSLTGSIGVLIQYGQINGLLDELGIEIAKVESGPLKAEPNPFEPVAPDAVAMLQSIVDDTYGWFVGLVAERRQLAPDEARRLGDGRIFTGAQALEARLIDAIGDEETAVTWMETARALPPDLPVRTYTPREDDFSLTARLADRALDRLAGAMGITLPPFRPSGSVDGLWSLWQAPVPSDVKGN